MQQIPETGVGAAHKALKRAVYQAGELHSRQPTAMNKAFLVRLKTIESLQFDRQRRFDRSEKLFAMRPSDKYPLPWKVEVDNTNRYDAKIVASNNKLVGTQLKNWGMAEEICKHAEVGATQ